VAIARALLRKPKILIFDEATSSLDAESEKYIHEAIFSLQGKLTLIIIAHRFSTIEHVDKIILLEQGKIVEIGTHKELIAKKGIFAKLRNLQELK
jgi:subfamily B ATP-binding cassette protein MsbA